MSSIDQRQQLFGGEGRSDAAKPRSVLVTGAASASGKSLAEQLVARGLRVHCADTRPMDVPSATCHLVAESPGFLPALARLARAEQIDLVIPANSIVLSEVSLGRVALGGRVELVMPGPGPIATAQDRLLTAWSLWSHGIAVPDFAVPSDLAAARTLPALLQRPLIVRSRAVGGDQPTTLVQTPAELDWASMVDDLLVQEFVPGPSYKAVVYRPLDGKGRLTTVLQETIGDDGEVTAAGVIDTPAVAEIERVAQAAVRALGLTGPVEVSLRERADGVAVVLDVRAGFGPHSQLVPELLDVVLRDHPPRSSVHSARDRLNGAPTGGFGARSARALPRGARL